MKGEINSDIFMIHTFRFLDTKFFEYIKSGDEKAKRIIIDWMCDYLDYGREKTQDVYYAWNDDSVARRVYRFAYWSYLFKDDISDLYMKKMIEELAYQSKLLTDEKFYNKKHNHGMYQDIGLIAYAIFWADDVVKGDYLLLAKERSGEYFDYVFTSEGVHKEHSPRYAYDVARNLLFYSKIYERIDKDFSQKYRTLYEESGNSFAVFTMPNGKIPSIGDSPEFRIDRDYWKNTKWYQYVAYNGTCGEMPPNNVIYPKSGYAVMRSSWKDESEQATYLLFTAATYSSTHKHNDDLNFLLYHKGPLFVEAGKRNYDYKNRETAYTYSNFGHNVMLVNGEGFPIFYADNGAQRISAQEMPTARATGITGYDMQADVAWVEGKQYRYHNATQTRLLSYDKTVENAAAEVIIRDTVEATEKLCAEFLYHIAPGVQVQQTETGWRLWRNETLVALVEIFSDADTSCRTIAGTGEGEYSTAVYNGKLQVQYGSVLVLKVACEKGTTECEIKITLSPDKHYKVGRKFRAINRASESAIEIPSSRPYGAYFIKVDVDGNVITAHNAFDIEGLSYAWEIYGEGKRERIYHTKYSDKPSMSYEINQPGIYYVKAWVKNASGQKQSAYSDAIAVES